MSDPYLSVLPYHWGERQTYQNAISSMPFQYLSGNQRATVFFGGGRVEVKCIYLLFWKAYVGTVP